MSESPRGHIGLVGRGRGRAGGGAGVGDATGVHVGLGGRVGGGAGLIGGRGQGGVGAADRRQPDHRVGHPHRGEGHIAGVGDQVAVGDRRDFRGRKAGDVGADFTIPIEGLWVAGHGQRRVVESTEGAHLGSAVAVPVLVIPPGIHVGLGGRVAGGAGLIGRRGPAWLPGSSPSTARTWGRSPRRRCSVTLPWLVTR